MSGRSPENRCLSLPTAAMVVSPRTGAFSSAAKQYGQSLPDKYRGARLIRFAGRRLRSDFFINTPNGQKGVSVPTVRDTPSGDNKCYGFNFSRAFCSGKHRLQCVQVLPENTPYLITTTRPQKQCYSCVKVKASPLSPDSQRLTPSTSASSSNVPIIEAVGQEKSHSVVLPGTVSDEFSGVGARHWKSCCKEPADGPPRHQHNTFSQFSKESPDSQVMPPLKQRALIPCGNASTSISPSLSASAT